MLILWCWALVLVHNVYSSKICSSNDDGLLAFAEQPYSTCLPEINAVQTRCSGFRKGFSDTESAGVNVKWNVSIVHGKMSPYRLDSNGSNSGITLTCDMRRPGGCTYNVWCSLTARSSGHGSFLGISNQTLSIRSRLAIIRIGHGVNCSTPHSGSDNMFINQQPEPRVRYLKVVAMSNVTLPCLSFVPYSVTHYFSTNWFFNGRSIFAGDGRPPEPFEANGVYNIGRKRKDDFFLWSNLTIYHVSWHHAGYYQCFLGEESNFNVILLDIITDQRLPNTLSPAVSLSVPLVLNVSYFSQDVRILFQSSKLSGDAVVAEAGQPLALEKIAPLYFAVGVIRQRTLGVDAISPQYMECPRGSGPGANTSFSGLYLASDGVKMADLAIPENFFPDQFLCRGFYAYAVFVKFFCPKLNLTATSPLYIINSEEVEMYNVYHQHFTSVAVDDVNSGAHFACFNVDRGTVLFNNLEHRITPQTKLAAPLGINMEPFCRCQDRQFLNSTPVTSSISIHYLPFLTGGLIPDVNYCINTESECLDYYVPVARSDYPLQHPLSYERLGHDIAVSWYLAGCQRVNGRGPWSTKLVTNGVPEPLFISIAEECSGRVVFKDVPNYSARHDASLVIQDHELYSLAIPAVLTVTNISALVVTRSRIVLSWTVTGFLDDIDENEKATELGFTIYGCFPSTEIPNTGVMDKKLLLCLGCQQLCRVPVYSSVPDVIYADVTDHDPHMTDFQIILWADVSLVVSPAGDEEEEASDQVMHETVPIGIVSKINVSLDDADIDGHRPREVAVVANTSLTPGGYYADFNISWLPPSSPLAMLTLISYTVTIVPVLHYLQFETDEVQMAKMVPADQTNILLTNITNELLLSESIGVRLCPRVSNEAYIIQVIPVWAWEHHDGSNNSFIVEGAASSPFIYRSDQSYKAIGSYERLLRERALSAADVSLANENEGKSRTTTLENDMLFGISSNLLPVPIVILCVLFICILLLAMFVIYRCQVRRNVSKRRPKTNESTEQETRSFTTLAPPVLSINPCTASPPLLTSSSEYPDA